MPPRKEFRTIRLERDGADRLIPKDFFSMLTHGLFPVLSLTYIASVLGIAANKGDFLYYLLEVKTAYEMALFVSLWASFPAIVWIFLHANPILTHLADFWYRVIAALMIFTLALSYFLFPEAQIYGLRLYFALSMPVFVVIYFFFVRGFLPPTIIYPLNALGFCTLMFGALINIVF